MQARGVFHNPVGGLGMLLYLGSWLWHLAFYSRRWWVEIRPNKGDWPPGIVYPPYLTSEFRSQRDGLIALGRFERDVAMGLWP